ncbi:hypothetical protein EV141_1367 [Microcella putealis]|uniref:Uncharacterized protein n=1 Tax=Microcella putealis TaxID=337005 RepID=A0A4Q7LTG9_9MICO|nr:hypothetical protein EV141_1367 [Microcella putealis]TQM24720.1 hypothetical protein BJ957_0976 [Microcella putealis]
MFRLVSVLALTVPREAADVVTALSYPRRPETPGGWHGDSR